MKVLVTGCFGFIGYNFIEFLKKNYGNDIKIYGIDKLTNSYSEYNSKKNNQIEFFKADINDINQIKDLQIDSLDGIFNFAAESHVDTSIYNPDIFINSNILGVSNLLQFSIKNNSKSFIHISTDEVYGSINKNFSLEDDKFFPSSPYSASKAGAEHIVKSYENTFGIDIKILRPANNFGKYQQPEKLIPFSFANLQYGGNIEIYGDGKNIRHWLYVQDTCKAIDFVFHKGRSGEAYNIGSGNYLTNLEISNKILGLMGLNEDRLEFVKDRPGHDFRYAVNTKKLESIGWSPDKDFDKQLYETIDWYKKNQDWWKKAFDKILSNRKKRYSLE